MKIRDVMFVRIAELGSFLAESFLRRFFILVFSAGIFITQFAFAETQTIWFYDRDTIWSEYDKDTQTQAVIKCKEAGTVSDEDIADIPPIQLLEKSRDVAKFKSMTSSVMVSFVEKEGEDFTALRLRGGGQTGEIGAPELPYYGQFIIVPKEAKIELAIDEVETIPILGDYKIFPMQPPQRDDEVKAPKFIKDEAKYKENKYIGEDKIVRITADGIIRGKRIIQVVYRPILYNPSINKLSAAWNVKWHLKYTYSKALSSQARDETWEKDFADSMGGLVMDASPESLSVLQSLTTQTAIAQAAQVAGTGYKVEGSGADYLIIVHDNFYDSILPLAEWKQEKGYKVKVVKLRH